jgi:hypothetical protein
MVSIARAYATLILVMLTSAGWVGAEIRQSYLEKRVCRFIFHGRNWHEGRHHSPVTQPGGLPEAMRMFAWHAEVPISLESIPDRTDDKIVPVEIDVRHTTVKDILEKMISQDSRYEYRERLGNIEVFPKGADLDPSDCLNMVIPVFRLRDGWNMLIEQLRAEVDIVSKDPKAWVPNPGTGGSFPGLPHPPPGLIEADFEHQTLRDILDLLCAKVGNMAWDATCQKATSGHVIELGTFQPRQWYASDTLPLTYSEGLPKSCIRCHYHKPCHDR